MQKNKIIETKDIKKWKRFRLGTAAIPVVFFLFRLSTIVTLWKENVTNAGDVDLVDD